MDDSTCFAVVAPHQRQRVAMSNRLRCACRRGCDETHGDGTGGDLAHIWLLPAEEQVDEQPADMVSVARAFDARQSK